MARHLEGRARWAKAQVEAPQRDSFHVDSPMHVGAGGAVSERESEDAVGKRESEDAVGERESETAAI